jgi:hypothetical protein
VLDSLTLPSGEADAGDIEAAPCCQMYARACASASEFVYWTVLPGGEDKKEACGQGRGV